MREPLLKKMEKSWETYEIAFHRILNIRYHLDLRRQHNIKIASGLKYPQGMAE